VILLNMVFLSNVADRFSGAVVHLITGGVLYIAALLLELLAA
jgi:hypothetical protein